MTSTEYVYTLKRVKGFCTPDVYDENSGQSRHLFKATNGELLSASRL